MNLGYAIFYSFHDMCCPYIIVGVYGSDKDDVERKFNRLVGINDTTSDYAKDWMEHTTVRIDCTKVYHMLQLEQEVDYDITRAFQNWAPKLFERIKDGQPGDAFQYKFLDGEAVRFEKLNEYVDKIDELIKADTLVRVAKAKEYRKKVREERNK